MSSFLKLTGDSKIIQLAESERDLSYCPHVDFMPCIALPAETDLISVMRKYISGKKQTKKQKQKKKVQGRYAELKNLKNDYNSVSLVTNTYKPTADLGDFTDTLNQLVLAEKSLTSRIQAHQQLLGTIVKKIEDIDEKANKIKSPV